MKHKRFLLIGWDAADWRIITPLLETGDLPYLSSLLQNGVAGDLATLEPSLSPLLWNSISTGRTADQHGVLGFTEYERTTGRVRPVSSRSRRTKALWNIASLAGLQSNVVGWFGSHPAESIRGAMVTDAFVRDVPRPGEDWPMVAGSVSPRHLAEALEEFRVRPEELDAEILRMFVPQAGRIELSKKGALDALATVIAEAASIHAAATWLMAEQPWDFMAVYHIAIDHFCHGFINYHPPKLDWVPEKDFEALSGVVASGYRLMDLFLGRMLQLAGPETTVMLLSDHGFHSGAERPRYIPMVPTGPASQHRPLGIFVLSGPGIRKGERIYGLNLLDIAPTALAILGLPAGQDMPGRVLLEAFEEPPRLDRIPSWETVPGDCGMHSTNAPEPADSMDQATADRLLQQFVALGYVDPAEPGGAEGKSSVREMNWNLARVYLNTGRPQLALEMLEALYLQNPKRRDFGMALADCQRVLGMFVEAEATVRAVTASDPDAPRAHVILGAIAFEQGRYQDALRHYLDAEHVAKTAAVYTATGSAYLRLRRWQDAKRAFEQSLTLNDEHPLTWQGIARVALRLGDYPKALDAALYSLQYRHDLPLTHVLLGIALYHHGRHGECFQALRTALQLEPSYRLAHRVLGRLLPTQEDRRRHAEAAREIQKRLKAAAAQRAAIREAARERARARAANPVAGSREFIVVSGLPRSGTSLMMQMLEAAGLPILSDGERRADEDNPEGYKEWEAVKTIASNPELIRQAEGKAVKVVSPLLPALPGGHRYRVLFMQRPIGEVLASQEKMLQRRGEAPAADRELLEEQMTRHREDILSWLLRSPDHELMVVDYPSLIAEPSVWMERITTFLGSLPNPEAMLKVIRPDLHRNRTEH